LVVARETVDHVAAGTAVEPVAASGPEQGVVAGAAVDHADEVGAARREGRNIQGIERHGCAAGRQHPAGVGPGRAHAEHPLVARIVRGRKVRRYEAERVVAHEPADPHLLEQRLAVRVSPGGREEPLIRHGAIRATRAIADADHLLAGRRRTEAADENPIVRRGALDDEDVGGVVIDRIGGCTAAAVVAVEAVVCFRRARNRAGIGGRHVEDEHVDAGAAIQRVEAGLTLEPVVVGPAPDRVVAATAVEAIVARAAEDGVGAAGEVAVVTLGVGVALDGIALHRVIARVAVDRLLTSAAVNPVATGAAVDLITGESHLGGCLAERPAVDVVDAVAAEEPLAGGGTSSNTAVAVQPIGALIAKDLIDPTPAEKHVVSATAADHVGVVAAKDGVPCGAAVGVVASSTAVELVGVAAAEEPVIAPVAFEPVLAVVGEPADRQSRKPRRHDPRHVGRIAPGRPGKVGRVGQRVGRPFEVGDRDHLHAAPDHVTAVTAADRVVAEAAHQEVVRGEALDAVVAIAAVDNATGDDRVVAELAEHKVGRVSAERIEAEGEHGVIVRARIDRVGADVTIKKVVARASVDDVDGAGVAADGRVA